MVAELFVAGVGCLRNSRASHDAAFVRLGVAQKDYVGSFFEFECASA